MPDTQIVLLIVLSVFMFLILLLLLLDRRSSKKETIQQSDWFSRFGEGVNQTLDKRISDLQMSNEQRLSEMRTLVDTKLHEVLGRRLTESFQMVYVQLEGVQRGLGEMKQLADESKNLRDTLMNVKARGEYGEIRLEALLADIMAPSQYLVNAAIDNRQVEFAVKLPGGDEGPVLLPIDSKFPKEDFQRILDATEKKDLEDARKAFAASIRRQAREISEKYIKPPLTTDFALLFLPTEGLYAEVIRDADLFEELQFRYKITVVGATTLAAYLGSLQMGFKTLAIEKRSREVWDTLRALQAEFDQFGEILESARKKIQEADATLDKLVGTRTRAINRQLRSLESMEQPCPPSSAQNDDIHLDAW